ncbi:MAG: hypothetical protein V1706_12445 [Pseudomonadota bacterium]
MLLPLFQWHLLAISKMYDCLARLDFQEARTHLNDVLSALPDHPEANRGLREVEFWENTFRDIAMLDELEAAQTLWENITEFSFNNSESHLTLKRNLIRELLRLLSTNPTIYKAPELCSGYLHLLLNDFANAEINLRLLVNHYPSNGRLRGYLADALWMQGRKENAAATYVLALLLSPQDVDVESLRCHALVAIIETYGPHLAPVYGFLEGHLPLVEQENKPISREARIYELLRRAEQARLLGRHQAMVDARRELKQLSPDILQLYLERLAM